jgi:hypothetical protein
MLQLNFHWKKIFKEIWGALVTKYPSTGVFGYHLRYYKMPGGYLTVTGAKLKIKNNYIYFTYKCNTNY